MQALVTPRLVLEPLVEAHADALYPILSDPRQLEFIDHGPPESLVALRSGYRKLELRRSPDGREHWLNWALCPRAGDRSAIGFVQATVREDRSAWVAYQLAASRWGQGYAGEATQAMVEHLVDAWGVTRCQASVDARNERSCRLLERLGFQPTARISASAPGDLIYQRYFAAADAASGLSC